MKRRTAAAPLLLALVAAALVAPAGSSAASSCTAGVTKVGGKPAHAFCGPAKAVAQVGTKRYSFTGGVCQRSGAVFSVNIGTVVINPVANAKPGSTPYFGLTVVPPLVGVHVGQTLGWISGGKRFSVLGNRIKLTKGLKSGSFSGKSLPGGAKVTGTFTC
ncbi:MAG: hypothetical protein ABI317_17415 [Gaiellales bacterium]